MSLSEFHGYRDSVLWRLTASGVEIEGVNGVERTRGRPVTATNIWEAYNNEINQAARKTKVPCALIVATICTESRGRADAIRTEPGYVSDEQTPNRISVGLTQTLISTAREAMQMSFGRDWLLSPGNAILAGTNYIAQQARKTGLDPPLVAAAYNAGGLYHQKGARNRWKLRQYPIGTGKHCDRFVQFFGDAVHVLAGHAKTPAVGLEALLGPKDTTAGARPRPQADKREQVEIRFAKNARSEDVTTYSLKVLKEDVATAGLKSALISSTSRDPYNQARVMYDNLERNGVEHQKKLYGPSGDKVIDVYAAKKKAGKKREEIIIAMRDKIRDLGPTKVSRHASDPKKLNVFDVAPSSISNKPSFEKAVKADARVAKFLVPPSDPGYHLEIPQPKEKA